uniref:G_PROTEIN_RECEP_F1_2 domain-containing protein n=1 Tax=Elaeophora elaphi TaxID=1147741 RepID=A0A0R3RK57_9BILA
MVKVGLVWYFTVIANCVSIKYVEVLIFSTSNSNINSFTVNTMAFHGNPNANTANIYGYMEMRRERRDSRNIEKKEFCYRKSENFRSMVRRSIRRQRYDEFMIDMITKHSKAVAVTISLSATLTIVIITIAVAITAILQCSLCYDQFIPESTVL